MKLNFKFLAPLILGVLFSFQGNGQNGYTMSRLSFSPAVDTALMTYKPNGTAVRYLDNEIYFKRQGIWTKWTNAASGGASIGGAITGGTAKSVLFVNPAAIIAQDNANFSYDAATKIFMGSFIRTAATTSAQAQFNLAPTGTVPISPNSGDVWHNSGANTLQMRLGGLTQNIIPGNLTTTRIPFAQANGWLVDDVNFTYAASAGLSLNNAFTNGGGSVGAGSATSTTITGQSVTGAGTAAGNITLTGGSSNVTGVPGGSIVLNAGNAGTGTANGGGISFSGGNGVGGGTVGNISFIGGGTSKVQMNHLSGKTSGAASVTGGTGAGTGPTITSVNPTDLAGEVRALTGTTPAASQTVISVTLSRSFDAADFHVILTPANAAAAALTGTSQVFAVTTAANTFTITSGSVGLVASTQYNWNYFLVQ